MSVVEETIAKLGERSSSELVAALVATVYPGDFIHDRNDVLLRQFLKHVVNETIRHRLKYNEIYKWPGLTSIQLENLKMWAVEQAVLLIKKSR